MSRTIQEIESEVLQLDAHDRATLAKSLLVSLEALTEAEYEKLWIEEGEARYAGFAGLGDRFIADVENIITHVRRYPQSGVRVSRNLRKRVLTVFRHDVLYVDALDEVIVVAVAPHSRRPGYWRDRLKKLG